MTDAQTLPGGKVYGDCCCPSCKAIRLPRSDLQIPADYILEFRVGETAYFSIDAVRAKIAAHKDAVRREASAPPKVNLPDATLTDGGRTTLRLLFWRGPQQEDTLPASGGAELIECGWAFKVNGWHALTENGVGAALQRGYGREKERKPYAS